jgi:hypothetical protein
MRTVKKQNPASSQHEQATVYREIPAAAAAVAPAPVAQPGEVGAAAVRAAALNQLERYADDIEQYVNASNMRLLLNRIQCDLKKDDPAGGPKMRLRRE